MQRVSPLQEYEPKDWSGLTTKNHLGAIYQNKPQDTSQMINMLYRANRGTNFGLVLQKFSPLTLKTDDDFRWRLQGSSKKNIPLVACTVNGSAITTSSQTGRNGGRFTLTFPEQYFSDTNLIVGEKNSVYPIRIVAIPNPNGTLWDYECELFTGDTDLYIPYDELVAGKRFSKEWSIVEKTLSIKGGTPTYTSPFSMKNTFSMIRMQDTRPGNMISRPVAFSWRAMDADGKEKTMTTWTQYADWEFETQFQDMKDKLINFATTNRADDGTFKQIGYSGFKIEQGAGLEQQIEASNVLYYNDFDIDIEWLTEAIMDLTDDTKGGYGQTRKVIMRTGKWGAYNFHKAIKNYTTLYTPFISSDEKYKSGTGWGFHENYVEYWGPDGTQLGVMVDSTFDDRERNKVMHPSGKGVAQSFVYQILNVGRTGGEDNIRPVYAEDMEDFMGYQPGLRDPFQAKGARRFMSSPEDGYTFHRAFQGGVMVNDPTRCATIKPSVLG
jgi:hypothetical protein